MPVAKLLTFVPTFLPRMAWVLGHVDPPDPPVLRGRGLDLY